MLNTVRGGPFAKYSFACFDNLGGLTHNACQPGQRTQPDLYSGLLLTVSYRRMLLFWVEAGSRK